MDKKLGELLIAAGVISPDQLEAALGRQRRFGGRVATALLAMGHADESTLALFLSQLLGVPFVVLSQSAIPLELFKTMPLEVARKHKAMPVHKDGRELFVAMADPKSIAALDELRFVTGARVVEHGALIGPVSEALEEAYRQLDYGSTVFWEGIDLDPSLDLSGDTGHVKIVVGRHGLGDLAPEQPHADPGPLESESALEADQDWVGVLESGQSLAPEKPTEKKTVLVVDDEPELRHMLRLFLEKSGYEVWEAADGGQALSQLQKQLPNLIVLDAMLPGVHGFDICYRVKNAEATRHIPVIMISAVYRGWRYATDVKRLYGADAFLEKPLRLDELKHLLQSSLDNSTDAASAEELSLKASAALRQAAASYKKGDLMGSAHHMEEAVAAAPFAAQLHHRLGLLYDKLGETYRAIAELERAVELDSTYAYVLALARVYEKTGFTNKAYESWERCLRVCKDEKEIETIKQHMQRLLPQ